MLLELNDVSCEAGIRRVARSPFFAARRTAVLHVTHAPDEASYLTDSVTRVFNGAFATEGCQNMHKKSVPSLVRFDFLLSRFPRLRSTP